MFHRPSHESNKTVQKKAPKFPDMKLDLFAVCCTHTAVMPLQAIETAAYSQVWNAYARMHQHPQTRCKQFSSEELFYDMWIFMEKTKHTDFPFDKFWLRSNTIIFIFIQIFFSRQSSQGVFCSFKILFSLIIPNFERLTPTPGQCSCQYLFRDQYGLILLLKESIIKTL